MKTLAVLLPIALMTSAAFATVNEDGVEKTCGQSQSQAPTPVAYTYCVSITPGSQNPDVLYYMHGGGGDADSWKGNKNPISKAWLRENFQAPTVIEISFGPFWVLTPQLGTPESGLLEVFTEELMPSLESRFLAKPVGARRLYGFSMGGSNTAMLLINRPDLFKSAVLRSPAIPGVSPHATEAEFEAYSKRSGISVDSIKGLSGFLTELLPTNEDFEKYAPLQAGKRLLNSKTPPMLITLGKKDEAYYFGGQEFADAAIANGVNVQLEVFPEGDHFAGNPEAAAHFLIK